MSGATRFFLSSTHRYMQTLTHSISTTHLGPSQESIEKKVLEHTVNHQLDGEWSSLVQRGSIVRAVDSNIKQLYEVVARAITSEMDQSIHTVKGYIHAPLFDPIVYSAKNMNTLGKLLDQNGSLRVYFIQENYDALTEEQRNVYRAFVSRLNVIEGPLMGGAHSIPRGLAGSTYSFQTVEGNKFIFASRTDTKKIALWWGPSDLPTVNSRFMRVAKFLYEHSPYIGA